MTENDVWGHKAYLFLEAEYRALIGDLQGLNRIEPRITDADGVFPAVSVNDNAASSQVLQQAQEYFDKQLNAVSTVDDAKTDHERDPGAHSRAAQEKRLWNCRTGERRHTAKE